MNSNNLPVSFTLNETHILVTLADGRIVGAPIDWWPWLSEAVANHADYIIGTDSILWPNYDGIDMEVMLLGQ